MLTNLIKRRFFKHHDHLLAYMDALEEVAGVIEVASDPGLEFPKHWELLSEFFTFIQTDEVQHETEEEKVLLPAVEQHIDSEKTPGISVDRMIRDHRRGAELVAELNDASSRLRSQKNPEAITFRIFAKRLQELIWHFRRHIEEENSFIIPLAKELFPEDQKSN